MTRREFATLPVLALPVTGSIALPAIAAAEMPATLLLPRETVGGLTAGETRFVERRVYASKLDAKQVLRDLGMPIVPGTQELLFSFASLEARETAWRKLAGDPRWIPENFRLKELAIYQIRGMRCGAR